MRGEEREGERREWDVGTTSLIHEGFFWKSMWRTI